MAFCDRGSGILMAGNIQDGDWRTSKMNYGDNKDSSVPRDVISPHSAKDDVIWKRVAGNTLLGATGGVVFGTLLATYRGHSVPFYAAGMGANYGIASFAFFGSEALIREARGGKRDALGCAGAGWMTGLAMTLPIGGRYKALVAGVVMAGVGVGGFYGHRAARAYLDDLGQKRLKEREMDRLVRERGEDAKGPKVIVSPSSKTGGWGTR